MRVVGQFDAEVDAVDDDRAEPHPDPVLERERRLDHLVHRRRLGQGDQHDLAALRILQELQHVIGLGPHRTRADRFGQARAPR